MKKRAKQQYAYLAVFPQSSISSVKEKTRPPLVVDVTREAVLKDREALKQRLKNVHTGPRKLQFFEILSTIRRKETNWS